VEDKLRIHIHNKGEKTASLTCNWCQEPHQVEENYKSEILERGKEHIEENKEEIEKRNIQITPEQTWTCGKCMLFLHKVPEGLIDGIQTDCHDHEIPKERKK